MKNKLSDYLISSDPLTYDIEALFKFPINQILKMQEKKESIGAFWKKQTSKGEVLTGSITVDGKTIRLAVWPNQYKQEDKHPDFKVFLDTFEPKKTEPQPEPQTQQAPDDGDGLPF